MEKIPLPTDCFITSRKLELTKIWIRFPVDLGEAKGMRTDFRVCADDKYLNEQMNKPFCGVYENLGLAIS